MRSIIPAKFCNSADLSSFGIHAIVAPEQEFDLMDPDLSDVGVDMAELEAVNRSLAPHAEEVDNLAPRRSYRIEDYFGRIPPTPPARVLRRRLAA